MMRVWAYTAQPEPPQTFPLIKARGLFLLQLEYLTRYPTVECVVTGYYPGVRALAGLFPKTLFHVYRSPSATPDEAPEPNMLCHAVPFDKGLARLLGASQRRVSILFSGENPARQMAMYLAARPLSALLLLTQPPEEYLAGELIYPLWCARNSHLAALVPSSEWAASFRYGARRYLEGIREFHERTRATDEYDQAMETLILRAYAGVQCSPEASELLAEVVRMGLPAKEEADLHLWDAPGAGDA
jgi:hypothetical protein